MYPEPMIIEAAGRRLAIEDAGPPSGFPILAHSGDGSRHIFPGAAADAAASGFRMIGYDRPGSGLSDSLPGRSVADCAADVTAIVQALGLTAAAAWGASGGGPYALASAALLPEVFTAVCLFAPIGPYAQPGLDFTAGMSWEQEARAEIDGYFSDPVAARARFEAGIPEQLATRSDTDWWMVRWGDRAGRDRAYSREWADHLAASAADGSGGGWWDDWTAGLRPWGFDLRQVGAPVAIWQGMQDQAVPPAHARWLAAALPHADLRLADAEDHTNIEENNRASALAWLRNVV
jgi:pimeloyl-ACP methyl ester carboxylesterase